MAPTTGFCASALRLVPHPRPLSTLSPRHPRPSPCWHHRARCSLLSAPFPLPDLFALATPCFSTRAVSPDLRPELLGSLLWTCGLYLGVWGERWGARVRAGLTSALTLAMAGRAGLAEAVADATHSMPFLLCGFAVDALMRAQSGGDAGGAVASGLGVALYAGVAELGRVSARSGALSEAERMRFARFAEFARAALRPAGRCHLVDVRAALRRDARYAAIARASDAELRAFISRFAPSARRSPNGFYRGLSVREHDGAQRMQERR